MGMRVRALLGIAVAVIVVTAACAESPNAANEPGGTAAQVPGNLSSPPVPLTDPTIALRGVGDRYLFLRSSQQAAVFDLVDQTWTELPTPPKLQNVSLGSVGSTVILVGLDCAPACAQDVPAPVAAASLDLHADAPSWTTSQLPVGPQQADSFGAAAVGELDGEFLYYINLDLVTVSPRLKAQKLPLPPTHAYRFCAVGSAVQALAVSAEAANLPEFQQVTDPRGTSMLVQAEAAGARTSWQPLPNSETATLAAPNPFFSGIMCGSHGFVLVLGDQGYEWDGQSWIGRPITTSIYGITESVLTADGKLVASGTDLVVLADGAWSNVRVTDQLPGVPPPILRITAVGKSIVVYDSPRGPNESGELKLVNI
ncbi:MAG TPA: hypothetical protein VGN51_19325 [Acidimicrobiia bacterium]|jgi:hypothetical protein